MTMKEVIQQIGQNANMLPREKGVTLPLVRQENDQIIVRRLIYFTRTVPGEGTYITSPQYEAVYNLTKEKFVTLKRFEQDIPNLPPSPWIHNRPAFAKAEDIIPEFERIWQLYDILIPAYFQGTEGVSAKVIDAAKQFSRYFHRHAEKPLSAYYDWYSGDFLRWIGHTSKQ